MPHAIFGKGLFTLIPLVPKTITVPQVMSYDDTMPNFVKLDAPKERKGEQNKQGASKQPKQSHIVWIEMPLFMCKY
jgi:hypothetical protein